MENNLAIEGALDRMKSRPNLDSENHEIKHGWNDWSDWNDVPDFPNWEDSGDGPR